MVFQYVFNKIEFQSTLPVGGATGAPYNLRGFQKHFNPRSPWGERLCLTFHLMVISQFQSTLPVGGATLLHADPLPGIKISIHAPRGGSDLLPGA